MEPFTLLTGALIAFASFGLGHLNGRRRQLSAAPRSVCEGCDHGLSYHLDGVRCHGMGGQCSCQQYVGPIPADRMLASFTSPESPVRTDLQ